MTPSDPQPADWEIRQEIDDYAERMARNVDAIHGGLNDPIVDGPQTAWSEATVRIVKASVFAVILITVIVFAFIALLPR